MSWQPFHSCYEAFALTILKESRQTWLYKPPRNEWLHPKCLDASWVAKTKHPDFISLQFIHFFLCQSAPKLSLYVLLAAFLNLPVVNPSHTQDIPAFKTDVNLVQLLLLVSKQTTKARSFTENSNKIRVPHLCRKVPVWRWQSSNTYLSTTATSVLFVAVCCWVLHPADQVNVWGLARQVLIKQPCTTSYLQPCIYCLYIYFLNGIKDRKQ